eukprot:gene8007-2801_t
MAEVTDLKPEEKSEKTGEDTQAAAEAEAEAEKASLGIKGAPKFATVAE